MEDFTFDGLSTVPQRTARITELSFDDLTGMGDAGAAVTMKGGKVGRPGRLEDWDAWKTSTWGQLLREDYLCNTPGSPNLTHFFDFDFQFK